MIKINISNIDDICKNYSNEIEGKFEERKKVVLSIISALQSTNEINRTFFGKTNYGLLQSAFGVIFSKPDVTNMDKEDFIKLINSQRNSIDKRAKCRKNKKLDDLKELLNDLSDKVISSNLIGCDYLVSSPK